MKPFTKHSLKNGDVVLFQNNKVGIYNETLKMFIMHDSWVNCAQLNNDLTCTYLAEYDIVAVRRPTAMHHCMFSAFESKLGTLVYERKEIEEMTLEQVCKLLGKEIKIIK